MMNNSNIAYECFQGPRDRIEDSFDAFEMSLPMRDCTFKFLEVSDGVGGYNGGDVGSNHTVKIIQKSIAKAILSKKEKLNLSDLLKNACQDANHEILSLQKTKLDWRNMSATIVAVLIVGDILHVIWGGDSRCYHCTNNEFLQLTRDHSVVQELIDTGQLQPEYASLHPAAHTITQYVGKKDFQPESNQAVLSFGDIIILTSDGATDVLSDIDFINYIEGYRDGQFAFSQLPHLLAKLALDRGTTDNTTIICYEHLSNIFPEVVFPDFTLTGAYAQELSNELILFGKDDLS